MAKQIFRPGDRSPVSAQMKVVGPRGGVSGKEITTVKGKVLPPGPVPGVTYRIADRTNNTSGKGR
jgi:hypothetical protein